MLSEGSRRRKRLVHCPLGRRDAPPQVSGNDLRWAFRAAWHTVILPSCAAILNAAATSSALDNARDGHEEIQRELERIDSELDRLRSAPAVPGSLVGRQNGVASFGRG